MKPRRSWVQGAAGKALLRMRWESLQGPQQRSGNLTDLGHSMVAAVLGITGGMSLVKFSGKPSPVELCAGLLGEVLMITLVSEEGAQAWAQGEVELPCGAGEASAGGS